MKQRCAACGGEWSIDSTAGGGSAGTHVCPVKSTAGAAPALPIFHRMEIEGRDASGTTEACLHLQAFGCEQCKAVCKKLTEERDAALLQIKQLKNKDPRELYGHWSTAQLALKAMTKERDASLLQIEGWLKYVALLQEELESAISMAYRHGWRSTPEKIEAGKQLRAELGLPDNELDAVMKEREAKTQKSECICGPNLDSHLSACPEYARKRKDRA